MRTTPTSISGLLCLALALAATSGGLGKAMATRALQAQQQAATSPPDQNCTANATAGGYDCVVGGQTVHVNATANVTQVGRSVGRSWVGLLGVAVCACVIHHANSTSPLPPPD